MSNQEQELPAARHYKTGNTYDVLADDALIEATKERAVVYRDRRTQQIWVRPFADFHAMVEAEGAKGRFVPRFERVYFLTDKAGPCEPGCSEERPCGTPDGK